MEPQCIGQRSHHTMYFRVKQSKSCTPDLIDVVRTTMYSLRSLLIVILSLVGPCASGSYVHRAALFYLYSLDTGIKK
jgi:hypothetical protein